MDYQLKINANFCFTYDKCGTFAMNMNLGAFACVSSWTAGAATGGIIPLIASFQDTIDNFGFGFSLDRNFEREVEVATFHPD